MGVQVCVTLGKRPHPAAPWAGNKRRLPQRVCEDYTDQAWHSAWHIAGAPWRAGQIEWYRPAQRTGGQRPGKVGQELGRCTGNREAGPREGEREGGQARARSRCVWSGRGPERAGSPGERARARRTETWGGAPPSPPRESVPVSLTPSSSRPPRPLCAPPPPAGLQPRSRPPCTDSWYLITV